MKRMLAATALILAGLVPGIGAACEYDGASSASATPPAQLAVTPPPAATMVPAPKVAKAFAPKQAKPVAEKIKASAPEQKLAAVTGN